MYNKGLENFYLFLVKTIKKGDRRIFDGPPYTIQILINLNHQGFDVFFNRGNGCNAKVLYQYLGDVG